MEIFNTIIGPSAEGKFYFRRPYLNTKIWKNIKNGCHMLVSAPRRIGKTSFLLNLCDQGDNKYLIKYHNTEPINSSNEFFKKLYKSLLEELSSREAIWESLTDLLKKNGIKKIGAEGLELSKIDLNYFEEFKRLITKVEIDKKIIFVIDEFSETLENIIQDQENDAGALFLHQNRALRQDPIINKKIQFIYSGSIGLGNIAERINAIKSINDLTDFEIPPFTEMEILAMIKQVTVNHDLIFEEKTKKYLIHKIHWLMPYYLQIILDEIETILLQQENILKISTEIIDEAIDKALEKRNYFEHWHTRLRVAYKGKYYTFAKDVLNKASKAKKGFSKTAMFDLGEKHNLGDEYSIIIRTLTYDGYINLEENKIFVFNSPLLKIWWERNVAI